MFTISEYYDKDRASFYKAIQSVRDNDMDMTGWLDYFITGLKSQMLNVKNKAEQSIKLDLVSSKYNLNERQIKAIELIYDKGKMTIQELEAVCPDTGRRTLQRDMKFLIDKKIVATEGATNRLIYKPVF